MSDPELPPIVGQAAEIRATRGRGKHEKRRAIAGAVTELDADNDAGPLDPAVYEGLAGFRFALRRFLAFGEVIASAAGITSQQYQAMLAIKVHPGDAIMMKELAEQMLLLPHGAVQLVDRLATAGLVERRQSPADRRSVLVELTAHGERLLERLAADHSRELLENEPLLAESLGRLRQIGQSRGAP